MQFMTRDVFDLLIVIVILLGLALAAVRLYDDLTRPLPPEPDDDTQPSRTIQQPDSQGE